MRELYTICTREIENFLQTNKGRDFFRTSVDVSQELRQLKNMIKNSRLREFVKAQNFIYDSNVETNIIEKGDKQLLLTNLTSRKKSRFGKLRQPLAMWRIPSCTHSTGKSSSETGKQHHFGRFGFCQLYLRSREDFHLKKKRKSSIMPTGR